MLIAAFQRDLDTRPPLEKPPWKRYPATLPPGKVTLVTSPNDGILRPCGGAPPGAVIQITPIRGISHSRLSAATV